MKKVICITTLVAAALLSSPANSKADVILASPETSAFASAPRPIYIPIRVGIFAKWTIAFGDCPSGWGLCISIGLSTSSNAEMFYDESASRLGMRVGPDSDIYDRLEESLNIEEGEHLLDPKIASGLNISGQVYVVGRKYTATSVNGYKEVYFDYRIE